MTQNTPSPQVWPTLRARDARALIAFLVEAFGFEETAVFGEGDRVDHAQLSWPPGGGIMLASTAADPDADDWPLPPGSFGAYVVTDDPDGLYKRAAAAGAAIVRELNDTSYGSREFAVLDVEGNRWSFGTTAASRAARADRSPHPDDRFPARLWREKTDRKRSAAVPGMDRRGPAGDRDNAAERAPPCPAAP